MDTPPRRGPDLRPSMFTRNLRSPPEGQLVRVGSLGDMEVDLLLPVDSATRQGAYP